jgi:hypothetical protein
VVPPGQSELLKQLMYGSQVPWLMTPVQGWLVQKSGQSALLVQEPPSL